jgi:Fe2+ or Zn2+ uptake regulation protein
MHHLTQQLQAQGHRMTPQRGAILRILEQSPTHLTPVEIFGLASQALPGLTEPTVYRTLSFFVNQGLVLVAHAENGQLAYEAAGREHHHLICRACNYEIEIEPTILQLFYQQLAQSTGYTIESPHMTFFGLCPGCQKLVHS